MDGRDKNKVLRRNVKGSIQIGDILMLRKQNSKLPIDKSRKGSG